MISGPGLGSPQAASRNGEAIIQLLILASARLNTVKLDNYKSVASVIGSKLTKIRYEPLFNPHQFGQERRQFQKNSGFTLKQPTDSLTYPVIATEFVSMEDGTGIVHIAPSYGEVDYQAGEKYNLDFVHTVVEW